MKSVKTLTLLTLVVGLTAAQVAFAQQADSTLSASTPEVAKTQVPAAKQVTSNAGTEPSAQRAS